MTLVNPAIFFLVSISFNCGLDQIFFPRMKPDCLLTAERIEVTMTTYSTTYFYVAKNWALINHSVETWHTLNFRQWTKRIIVTSIIGEGFSVSKVSEIITKQLLYFLCFRSCLCDCARALEEVSRLLESVRHDDHVVVKRFNKLLK